MKRAFYASLFLCAASTLLGCGPKKPDGMPKLAPVVVTVVQEGTPLAEANVSFYAEAQENRQWACGGVTDASGKLTVTTRGKYPGMPLGKYKVTVEKTLVEDPPLTDEEFKATPPKIYQCVESKYLAENTTDLAVEVVDGKNEFTLDAGKAIKEKKN